MSYIYLSAGREYDILDGGSLLLEDIAVSLSRQCRFTGHGKFFFSVAQHCCNLVDLAERSGVTDKNELISLLLHDGAEAVVGDISTPMKQLLGNSYEEIENPIQEAVYRFFGVEESPRYKEFDRDCAVAEIWLLFGRVDGEVKEMKYDTELLPNEAYEVFIRMYSYLCMKE